MYAIFGATGNTGSAVARTLIEAGKKVRAIGRDADRLKASAQAGAETVTADAEDAASVTKALTGATAAYLLIPPNFATDDFRAFQRRVVQTLARAVRAADLSHVALLSSLGADHESGTGPIVGLHELETAMREIDGVSVLSIRAGYFMENFFMNVGTVKSMGVLAAPIPAGAPMSLIAAEDIGRYAGQRLTALDWEGFEVTNLIGPSVPTMGEVCGALGRAIGKPDLPYVQLGYDEAEAGMVAAGLKPALAALYRELYQGAAAGLLMPEAGTAVTNTATPFAGFAARFAAAYAQANAA